jgi:hypothetical protein
MQSIFLEGLGGEHKVDPILQETTFIQHIFGGRLRSKVFIIAHFLRTFVFDLVVNNLYSITCIRFF